MATIALDPPAAPTRWWNRRGVRRLVWQCLLAAALLAALGWLVGNVRQNLPRMGIQFGFDFLAHRPGSRSART
jgi:ABC-type amino acid transport system permease subunit